MFNFARQGFANPLLSAIGASSQAGFGGSVGRCPTCGNVVTTAGATSGGQPSIPGYNPVGVGPQVPFGTSPGLGLGSTNPVAAQFASGAMPNINPLAAQLLTNWAATAHLSNPGVGRAGAYGIDPRFAAGAGGPQAGYVDPNIAPFGISPTIAGDPIGLQQLSQQQPMVNPFVQQQQQLPIRSLIPGQQGIGSQQLTPGFASPAGQWVDPYRAFIEAQLISQLLTNPLQQLQQLQQLQRGYGANPELAGPGMPFTGQPINPFVNPFYA